MHNDAPMQSTEVSIQKASGTRITVTLPPDQYGDVLRLAKSKRVSASWVVRDAVEKYLAADIPLLANIGKEGR
jgi:hypothetical protein